MLLDLFSGKTNAGSVRLEAFATQRSTYDSASATSKYALIAPLARSKGGACRNPSHLRPLRREHSMDNRHAAGGLLEQLSTLQHASDAEALRTDGRKVNSPPG